MKTTNAFARGSVVAAITAFFAWWAAPAQGGPAPIPFHMKPWAAESGVHDGKGDIAILAFSIEAHEPGATWLRVHFDSCHLSPGSFLLMTSRQDGGQQRLDAISLGQWRNASAYFNGDRVIVELHVGPGAQDDFFRINELTVGDPSQVGGPEDLCGADNRVASTDPRVGRLIPVGCTGWIVSNGAHLTAGHCCDVPASINTLEFNIPASLCDGTIVFSNPNDQYAVIDASIVFADGPGGIGNDWGVFNCSPNSNTGLLPVRAQGAFYRMSRDDAPATVRVTGCGLDETPVGCTGNRNAQSQTLQTDTGAFGGEVVDSATDVSIEYFADTRNANSGSPVIITGTTMTIGIHTDGLCDTPPEGNFGTSFENDGLENAVAAFPGPVVRYVDVGHTHAAALGNGTVLRPFDTVTEAVTAVPSGGIVSIVAGTYTAAAGNLFTAGADGKAMTFQAPVGTVVIGE